MKYFLSTFLILTAIVSALAQGPNQMNFQGALYDNGQPIDGTASITFTIYDTDNTTPIWTETHTGLTVTAGYYSVVLGSTNPGTSDLPDDLFYGVDVREMNISVDYNSSVTDLGNIQLFAPLTGNSFSSVVTGDPLDNGTIVNDTSILMYDGGTGNDDGKLNVDLDNAGRLTLYGRDAGNTFIRSAVQAGQFGEGNSYVNLYGENQAGDGTAKMVDIYTFDQNIQFQNFNNNYRRGGIDFKDNEGNLLTAISGNRDDNGSDPTGQSGWVMTRGTNTPNVEFGGKFWDNNNLPFLQFFGTTSDGDTWYHNNLFMEVNTDGTNEWGRISIQNTDTGDPNATTETINLDGETGTGYFAGDLTVDGSIIGNVDVNAIDSIGKDMTGSPKSYGFIAAITGDSATAPGYFYDAAVIGEARTDFNNNVGVYGWAEAGDESTNKFQTGVEGYAGGNSPSLKYGVRGIVGGENSGYTVGGLGYNQAIIPDNGTAHGLYGRVFNGAPGATSFGVRGRAQGAGGTNYGIYGEALNGDENWAGWFEGDVTITGTLTANLGNVGNNAYAFGEKDWETDNQGFVHLYGQTTTGDNLRVALEVYGEEDNASGGLSLYGPVYNDGGCATCPRNFVDVGVSNDTGGNDPTGWAGNINLSGMNSPNILLGSQSYESHDLGNISLYGNKPDGGGWYYNHVNLSVNRDGSQEWGVLSLLGNDGDQNVEIGSKSWEDASVGALRPFLRMQGSINDDDLVWLDVFDDGNTHEAGGVTFRSTDGSEFGINAYGLTGQLSDLSVGNNITVLGNGYHGLNINNSTDSSYAVISAYEENDYGVLDLTTDAGNTSISLNGQLGAINLGTNSYTDGIVLNNTAPQIQMFSGGTENITLNADNGSGSFSGDVSSNSFSLNNNAVSLNFANNGNGDFGQLQLESDGSDNRISMGFADTGDDSGFISIWQNNGGGTDEYVLLNTVTGGPGGALYGSLNMKDDLGNSVSVNGYGDITASGTVTATTVTQTSDHRLKTNIKPLKGSLGNVLSLRGVSYNWLDPKNSQDDQIGVIAQEVEEVYPEFVHTNENGYKSVNYAQMSAVLIEAIKELNAEVESLKKENQDLKAQVNKADDLEVRLLKLEKLIGVSAGESSNANNN